MIIVIDGLNRHRYSRLLDEMFALRARVFGQRLGWDVNITDGKEIDQFDGLDPAYVIGLNDDGHVVSCVRALQTTGPHMLSDVFHDILDGEPPLRSATLWESTRFCVDTEILDRGNSRNSVSYATCELMAASLEYAKNSGISDIVTVIDPVMNRVLKRSDCAPYGYVGSTKPMGKVSAMAALLDCSDERIGKIRAFAGIKGDIFVSDQRAFELSDDHVPTVRTPKAATVSQETQMRQLLEEYCVDQITDATTVEELEAAKRLTGLLVEAGMVDKRNSSGTHG
ncbi:acyl-homoserine-lactone synthase [Pseudosulfitobacter sp. DSM 107133]|uniref:acyl-homoserine-lactone synthase n=1 Tax=Pseudosulfitobacter sp. DSM 107133 TaxID=2883100 RepID=UPI000DF184B7|nr:acyl-homoserine-lactone synthase [Pseudosulfitobacter sp. DSM 107133]UOA25792.1 Acyl-homoserine-lactone synthase [Pseudosulfitobacter sp. DSM 107133]